MPLLLKSLGERSNIAIGSITAIPYAYSGVAMVAVAKSSDAELERRLHLAPSEASSELGILTAAFVHRLYGNVILALVVCMRFSTAGIHGILGPFWAIPTSVLSGETAATSFALINSVGVLGGVIGPWNLGVLTQEGGRYEPVLTLFGVMMVACILVALCLDPKL